MHKLRISLVLLMTAAAQPVSAVSQSGSIHSESRLGSLQSVLAEIVKWLFIFLPAVATFYLVLSGYRYMIAQGQPELVEKAKKSLTYALYGVIISYSAVALIATLGRGLGYSTGL